MTAEPGAEVARARAELTDALNSIEDRLNIPKQARRLREEHPAVVAAVIAGATVAVAAALWLGVRAVRRR